MDVSLNSGEPHSSDEDFLDDSEFEGESFSVHSESGVVYPEGNPESESENSNEVVILPPSEESISGDIIAEEHRAEDGPLPIEEDRTLDVRQFATSHNSPSKNLLSNVPSTSTSVSRKRSRESPSPNNESKSDDDAMMCPICFEFWTTSGSHRLVSLKCGHLFGLACIEKWIKQPKAKCPQCNHLARRNDIRKIYARSLKVLDTSERDRAVRELEKEQEKRRRAEVEAASMRLKLNLAQQECERIKVELMQHKNTIQKLRPSNKKGFASYTQCTQGLTKLEVPDALFVLEKTLDVSKDGGCRLLASSNFLPLIVASQPSTNPLYPGFGFKKINTMDFRPTEFVPVHQKLIKDLSFHAHDSLVLSTALDRTVKITNVMSNSIVQSYSLDVDAWSCVWSKDDPGSFFAGLRNGQVLQFDTRMTSGHVCQLPPTGKIHPVVALQYLPSNPFSSYYAASGPVSLQLQGCTFFEKKTPTEYVVHPIPVEGRFTSLSLEPKTGHLLISCRPSAVHSNAVHMLCELTFANASLDPSVIERICSTNVVQTYEGGPSQTQLTRSHLTLKPGYDSSVLICTGDESSKTVMIWDSSGNKCQTRLAVDAPALDICSFQSHASISLAAVSDKQLKIFKWNNPY